MKILKTLKLGKEALLAKRLTKPTLLSPATAAAPATINKLDQLHQLYRDFAQTVVDNRLLPRDYHRLIVAGCTSGLPQGLEYSLETARELTSLGWQLDTNSRFALLESLITTRMFDAARAFITTEDTREMLVARLLVHIGLKDKEKAATVHQIIKQIKTAVNDSNQTGTFSVDSALKQYQQFIQ